MRALSASELLDVWERGASRGPIGRALEMLAAAAPEIDAPHLVSIGRRAALLLALRERTFGSAIQAVTSCGSCGEEIELSFAAADLGGAQEVASKLDVQIGAYRLRLRAPNSEDVAIALASGPGRIEVRAVNDTSPARKTTPQSSPVMGLDEYLRHKTKGAAQ